MPDKVRLDSPLDDVVVKLALLTLPISFGILMFLFAAFYPAARELVTNAYSFPALIAIHSIVGLFGTIPLLRSPWPRKALAIGIYLALAAAVGLVFAVTSVGVAAHWE